MHLKTLSLVGFKSFADRTRIECEPGVTVVVGPNGSGKSNLVDAIAWVMGTQATTSLRTEKMEDVIFAGTAVRPALGRAEVSLTFENNGALDIDLPEITITRRLYRDGTSEYEINDTGCRLLDIQEMLADSGVGRHQHVIVGQGRVDAVLNAGPDEHRAVIEEAAGVIKHRSRRDRSIRRLEATDQDVERLRELLGEQQKRLKPLRRQARAAEKHDALRAEWRAARLWAGGEQLRSVRDRLGALQAEQASLQKGLDSAVAERETTVARLPELQEAAGDVGGALERDTSAAARLETTAERLQAIGALARERRLHLERARDGATGRRRDLVGEQEDLRSRLSATAAEEAAATEAAERAEAALRSLEDEERALAEADRLPAEGAAASLRGDLASLQAAESRDSRESADLARRRGAVAAVIEEEVSEATTRRAELVSVRREREAAASAVEEADRKVRQDTAATDEADAAHRSAETAAAAARGRLEAVVEAQANGPGRTALQSAAEFEEVVAGVTARLDVPAPLLPAVRAALGAWTDGFVTTDRDGAARAALRLKEARLGGIGFITPAGHGDVGARRVGDAPALADSLGPSADALLAASLLGDVVLAPDWQSAARIATEHPDLRVVTREGDLFTAQGFLPGYPEDAGPAAVESARNELAAAENEAARAASRRTSALRARESSRLARTEKAELLSVCDRSVAGLEETIALLERSKAERTAELDRLDARARALADAAANRAERLADLNRRLATLDGEDDDTQAAWEEMTARRGDVTKRRDDARHRREQAAAALAAAAERREMIEARLAAVAQELSAGPAAFDEAARDRLSGVEEGALRALHAVRGHVEALRARQRSLRSELGDAGAQLDRAQARREALSTEIESTRQRLSEVSIETAELRVREESALEALRRDADADEEEALAAPAAEVPEGASPMEHAETLYARLRRLGPVNPLAAAEYAELSERVEFMEGQLADLEESRSDLRKVIRALDEEIARQFGEAFEEIAAMFAENFKLLFPGGTGKLTLTEPGNVLATGIEIHAQPMGKKVGRLQLLSGGERSLAALAFLFAVFRSRPSPFYVLDEVEAALDDANLRRFLKLVATLRDTSQLVIVTHQQQTMEAADLLYGVTMEPGDTSRLLAKRLTPA
jgi:chromosome segregation protein